MLLLFYLQKVDKSLKLLKKKVAVPLAALFGC